MGIYLVSVDAPEWFGTDEEGYGELASALNEELARRGLPAYESVPDAAPFVRGSGMAFEEKLVPQINTFSALCDEHLSPEDRATLSDWTVLVPISLEQEILLPIESSYTDESIVAGAPQVLSIATRLAAAIDLPPEVPEMCDNLDLTMWFLDGPAKELAATRPGRWGTDLDAAFYVAVLLRAAQHSLRRNAPIVFT